MTEIELIHLMVHDGRVFLASHRTDAVANDDSLTALVITGSKSVHLDAVCNLGGDFYIDVYEDATLSDNGTEIDVVNAARYSDNTPVASIYHTPTITDNGTRIRMLYESGGRTGNAQGGAGGGEVRAPEIVFKKNTNYLIVITNKSGSAKPASFDISFYEQG